MKLVDAIPGLDVKRDLLERAVLMIKSFIKVIIMVQEFPGFLVNRILLAYIGDWLMCA